MIRHLLVTALIVSVIYFGLLVAIDHPFVASAAESKADVAVEKGVANKAEEPLRNKVDSNESAITIYGLQKNIDFSRAGAEITQAWTDFLANESLQNNIDWDKGDIMVYAYYYDFNRDMSKGRLAIGFDGNDLLLSTDAISIELPQGKHQKFRYNSAAGTAEDKAWQAAYQTKNLIERHKLNVNGEIVASDVIIVQ